MTAGAGSLVSVNVGMPRDVEWRGRTVRTGIWKQPVDGPCHVGHTNLAGDGQGDLEGHGGEQRAVYVYQLDSYRYWSDHLRRDDFVHGQFGENFTVEGLGDDEVCIGDRYRIGSASFEVTQPRVTCYRLGIRLDEPRMPALLVAHGRPGFYLRVLEDGTVRAGDAITKIAAGPEQMTVRALNALLYVDAQPEAEDLRRALRISALSPGWKDSMRSLLEAGASGALAGGNAGLVPPAPPPAWSGFRALRVVAKRPETVDVVSLELEPDDATPLARAAPGQFVTVRLHPTGSGTPVIRSYSLSGPPEGERYRISVKVEPRGAAGHVVRDEIEVGDRIDVAAPRGRFVLDDRRTSLQPVVLVSAGVGVTPVLAMLHALGAAQTTGNVWWVHGARNRNEHAFAAEAEQLLTSLPNAHRLVFYSAPGPDDVPGVDYDEGGHVTADAIAAAGAPVTSDFFLCGPTAFIHSMQAGLGALGVRSADVHIEHFGSEDPITPGVVSGAERPPHAPDGAEGTGALVSFVRSGLRVRWSDQFASILEFAEACDVPVRWSCRTGVCHTCETGLLDGGVDYDPDPLEPPAVGNVLLCCSRPERDVTLDL